MEKTEKALSIFAGGFSCSQAVFAAFAEDLGLDDETALKISAPFGGGMGRMGETCGVISGALMALGLKFGSRESNTPESKDRMYAFVREFMEQFKGRNETIICKELLNCDMSTPEGLQESKDKGFHKTLCPAFVRDAAEILERMLAKE